MDAPRPKYDHIVRDDIFGNPLPSKFLRHLFGRSKSRARKSGMEFGLSTGFLDELYQSQSGRCAVTGLAFNLQFFPEALVKFPFAPSLDRRLSSGGYTRDNVRLVCVAANFGMGQWGEEVFLTLARSAVDFEKRHAPVEDAAGWQAALSERLIAAEELLPLLPPEERPKQRHHIAGLKSALTKGLAGTKTAAKKARGTSVRNKSAIV